MEKRRPSSRLRPSLGAFASSLALHVGAVGLVFVFFATRVDRPAASHGIGLTLVLTQDGSRAHPTPRPLREARHHVTRRSRKWSGQQSGGKRLEEHAAPVSTQPDKTASPVVTRFFDELHDALDREKEYPRLSRMRGESGTVEIGFTIKKNGQVVNAHVTKPSSYALLDAAGLEMVRRLGKFEPVPDELSESDWEVVVPITFTLFAEHE